MRFIASVALALISGCSTNNVANSAGHVDCPLVEVLWKGESHMSPEFDQASFDIRNVGNSGLRLPSFVGATHKVHPGFVETQFSDDNGRTWNAYTVNLDEYNRRVAWIDLAPGEKVVVQASLGGASIADQPRDRKFRIQIFLSEHCGIKSDIVPGSTINRLSGGGKSESYSAKPPLQK